MELKIVILSLFICVSLLTTPVLCTVALTRAVPDSAAHGASLIGTSLALKGAAAILGVRGLATLATRAAEVKGAMLSAALTTAAKVKESLLTPPKPIVVVEYDQFGNVVNIIERPKVPSILELISGILSTTQKRTQAISTVEEKLLVQRPRVLYEYVTDPRFYSAPVVKEIDIECQK